MQISKRDGISLEARQVCYCQRQDHQEEYREATVFVRSVVETIQSGNFVSSSTRSQETSGLSADFMNIFFASNNTFESEVSNYKLCNEMRLSGTVS
jgi:hypothetical protein